FDRRMLFLPDAKLLVTLPGTRDRLILRRLDIMRQLEASGTDYLVVTSPPTCVASQGEMYQHRLVIRSKRGGATCRLEAGPPGMTVTADGQVTWPVPANAEGERDVRIMVSDASGQEIEHRFAVRIAETARKTSGGN